MAFTGDVGIATLSNYVYVAGYGRRNLSELEEGIATNSATYCRSCSRLRRGGGYNSTVSQLLASSQLDLLEHN